MTIKASNIQQPEYDSLLQGVVDNLENFIESINCINETFGFSEITLRTYHKETNDKYNNFVKNCEQSKVNGHIIIKVPEGRVREFMRIRKKKERAERAFEIIPPSYFVSLVSTYDTFFAGLVRCYYNICPEKLKESDMSFCYRDLQQFENLNEVKKRIIDKNIETLLRESHIAQLEWLSKALELSTLTKFNGWNDFVELTERRNLFVHSNGTVNNQYIEVCKKHFDLGADILEGNKLTIDKYYFEKAYKTLYKISILLTQMLLRVKYLNKIGFEISSDVDKILINNVFDLISDQLYDVAIDVSETILENKKFVHNAFDREYLVLNYAQAYKWNGNVARCLDILKKEDWSAFTNELLIPRYALEDNYTEVYKRMRELGNCNQHITISAYREWPIFKDLRKEKEFEQVFAEIFGEELCDINDLELQSTREINEEISPFYLSKEAEE